MVTLKRKSFDGLVIAIVKVQLESYSKVCCITQLKGKHRNSISVPITHLTSALFCLFVYLFI